MSFHSSVLANFVHLLNYQKNSIKRSIDLIQISVSGIVRIYNAEIRIKKIGS